MTIVWGEKLGAIVLFFVPRALWPGKPIVGGLDIGNELFAAGMYGTPNLSFFVGCDLYMDFGFVGVALGGVVAAVALRSAVKADRGVFGGLRVVALRARLVAADPAARAGRAVLPLFVCQALWSWSCCRFAGEGWKRQRLEKGTGQPMTHADQRDLGILDAATSGSRQGGPSFALRHRALRVAWGVAWTLLAAWTPAPLHRWRALLLRLFGAQAGGECAGAWIGADLVSAEPCHGREYADRAAGDRLQHRTDPHLQRRHRLAGCASLHRHA
jgi:hypothetical protein